MNIHNSVAIDNNCLCIENEGNQCSLSTLFTFGELAI